MTLRPLHEAACNSENCGYRRLYEGTQMSLSDMAARQGQALSRVGRLRAGIVTTLRRHFPSLASQAESQAGRRMSDVDDEILLAYLDAFVAAPGAHFHESTIGALRAELEAAGVAVSGSNIEEWVVQLRRARTGSRPRGTFTPPVAAPTPAAPVPVGDLFAAKPADKQLPPLARRAHDDNPATSSQPAVADAQPVSAAPDHSAEPSPASKDPSPPDSGPPASAAERAGRGRSRRKDARPASQAPEPGTSTAAEFRDEVPPDLGDEPEHTEYEPVEYPKHHDGERETSGPAPAVPQPPAPVTIPDLWEGPLGDTAPTTERWSPSPVKARTAPDTRPGPPAAVDPLPARPAVEAPSVPLEVIEAPLRPQLTPAPPPTGRKKKPGRQLRTQAQAPDGELRIDLPAVTEPPVLELNPTMAQALMAACSIPRPVFTRDLVSVAGSMDVVDAWESECRSDPANYPVRFIAPKSRHRMRGSLVFSEAKAPAAADAWWPRCVEMYRGARLYELGVFLHRVGDEIVSAKFHSDMVVLRLSTQRGLVGIAIALDTRLEPGEPVHAQLREALGELLSERLSLVAVLTTSAEPGSLEGLVETIGELARVESWTPVAPVIAARSWEYADDRGSTAVLALGG